MPLQATPSGILIKNEAGETTLDTTRNPLYVCGYKSGTTTIPRGETSTSPVDIDLGAVDARTQIIGGSFQITDAEGLAPGERRFIGTHSNNRFSIYLYAPRIEPSDAFTIGGPTVIEGFHWPPVNTSVGNAETGSQPMNSGRAMHALQFVLNAGNLRLIRTGLQLAYWQATFGVPQGPVIAWYGNTFWCAALTIKYRIWCGAFT